MKELVLINSDLKVEVSDEDYIHLCFSSWYLHKNGYTQESTRLFDVNKRQQWLHIIIARRMALDLTHEIDHKDENKLNCQRENLRVANKSQNKANSSKAIGVVWREDVQKYQAYIRVNGERKHLGYFEKFSQARLIYQEAQVKYFGEFAPLI